MLPDVDLLQSARTRTATASAPHSSSNVPNAEEEQAGSSRTYWAI